MTSGSFTPGCGARAPASAEELLAAARGSSAGAGAELASHGFVIFRKLPSHAVAIALAGRLGLYDTNLSTPLPGVDRLVSVLHRTLLNSIKSYY